MFWKVTLDKYGNTTLRFGIVFEYLRSCLFTSTTRYDNMQLNICVNQGIDQNYVQQLRVMIAYWTGVCFAKQALNTQFPRDKCSTCPSVDSVFVFFFARRLPCRSVALAGLWTASLGWMGRRTFQGGSGVGKVESRISLTCYGSWEPFIDLGLASTQQIVRSAILLFPRPPYAH